MNMTVTPERSALLISKSKFLAGLQCQKLLWTACNANHLMPKPDSQTQVIFDQGNEVGVLAKKLFPDGLEVGLGIDDPDALLRITQEAVKRRRPLFEPVFSHEGGNARADILVPVDDGAWDLIEVKSSTSLKNVYIFDLAFQSFVIGGTGLKIRGCFLLLINPDYVRHGDIDPSKFFVRHDVTAKVAEASRQMEPRLDEMFATLRLEVQPAVTIGRHCDHPYNYPEDYQDNLLACIVAHPEKFMPYAGIFNSAYFTGVQRIATARALFNYWRKYGRFPGWDVLSQVVYDGIARTSEERDKETINDYIKKLRERDTGDVDDIAEHVIGWAQRRALYIAIDRAATEFQSGKVPQDGWIPMFEEALRTGFSERKARSLVELAQATIDPNETLLGNRFLCKGGGLMFAASAGTGKSTATNQMVAAWSCGKQAFGIKPARPLKIFVVQAEDDDGDAREMALSVLKGLELTEKELELVTKNTTYERDNTRSGDEFIGWLGVQALHYQPDLIVINPLLSFLGGKGVLDAATCTKFLRSGLNSVLTRYHCGCLLVHHTPKTNNQQRDTSKWRATDWVYAAAGSSEIANWCRAALVIESTHDDYVFKFIAAKRGRRVGWKNDFLDPVTVRYFKQSKDTLSTEDPMAEGQAGKDQVTEGETAGDDTFDKLFWEDATEEDVERAEAANKAAKGSGRPRAVSDATLLKSLKEAFTNGRGLTQTEWLDALAEIQVCISQPNLSKRVRKLKRAGKVRNEKEIWWFVEPNSAPKNGDSK